MDKESLERSWSFPAKNCRVISPGMDIGVWYAWLKSSDRDSYMGVLSATNRRTLYLTAGKFITEALLILDVDYVDVVALSVDPEATVVGRAGGGAVIKQTADTIGLCGFKIYNSGVVAGDHAFEINATDNSLATYRFMEFVKTTAKSTYPVYGASHINGLWEFCEGNDRFFTTAASMNLSGTFKFCQTDGTYCFNVGSGGALSGTFENCTGGDNAFYGGALSGTFNFCKGGESSFRGGTLSGAFDFCTAGIESFGGRAAGAGDECSGTFKSCTAGDRSFSFQNAFSGKAYNCIGGAACFGGYSGSGVDAGSFTGEAFDCIGTGRSFGGGVIGVIEATGTTGTLQDCVITGTIGLKVGPGSKFHNCRIESTDLGIRLEGDADTPVFYNCTIICVGDSFSAVNDEARNVIAAHCRMTTAMEVHIVNLVETSYNVVDANIT